MHSRLTEGTEPQTQGLDSLWCRAPLGNGKRGSSEWMQPGARGHLWQDQGGCISPVSLAGRPCAGYILHYGLRGGAFTASVSPSHPVLHTSAHQVLPWECWPGFLGICQPFTAPHSPARAATDTSASSLAFPAPAAFPEWAAATKSCPGIRSPSGKVAREPWGCFWLCWVSP